MSDSLAAESVSKICEHMNADHADALASYARVFGGVADVKAARLVALDPAGLDLSVETATGLVASRILFDHHVGDANDARATLIDMAVAAAKRESAAS